MPQPQVRASRATLERYKTDGAYACRLAGSGMSPILVFDSLFLSLKLLGSLYFLVLMACSRVRPLLRQLRGPICGGLARLIRWPTGKSLKKLLFLKHLIFFADSAHGTLIKTELIPAVAYLRKTYPLRVGLFFPTAFLEIFGVSPEVDCTNLMTTDAIFDSIYLYKFVNIFPSFYFSLCHL